VHPFGLAAQISKPTTLAELAVYNGPDREQLLIAGAKKEGKVIWYTALAGGSYRDLARAFETKYAVPVEAYRGTSLIIRSLACGLVYALLWGVFWFLGDRFFGPDAMKKGLQVFQMIVLIIPVFAAGTLAAFASFDLDPGSAFFHCALYFAVTVLLRLVAHLPAVPGLGGS